MGLAARLRLATRERSRERRTWLRDVSGERAVRWASPLACGSLRGKRAASGGGASRFMANASSMASPLACGSLRGKRVLRFGWAELHCWRRRGLRCASKRGSRSASGDRSPPRRSAPRRSASTASRCREIANDPFIPLAFAALATERIQLGTAIAVAFPRSPMVMANLAWDLQTNSGGRFALGLGAQVKGHNERRFSVPWSPPVPRLREYIESLRAIWRCWETRRSAPLRGRALSLHADDARVLAAARAACRRCR